MVSSVAAEVESIRRDGYIDLGVDPVVTDRIAAAVADAAHASEPSVIAHWSGDSDAILAHVAARTLGVPHVAVAVDEGLMTLSRDLPAASRVAFVGVRFDAYRLVGAVATFLEGNGHEVVIAIALLPPAAGAELGRVPFVQIA